MKLKYSLIRSIYALSFHKTLYYLKEKHFKHYIVSAVISMSAKQYDSEALPWHTNQIGLHNTLLLKKEIVMIRKRT